MMRFAMTFAFGVFLGGALAYAETEDRLRDRCWMWGHETGLVDGTNNIWNLEPAQSYYHMTEGAKSLGLENLNVVRWDRPARAFRDSLAGLKRVTWPISGRNLVGERKYEDVGYDELGDWCFRVADEMPNVTGFDLDDFFVPKKGMVSVRTPSGTRDCCATLFPYERLVELRRRMNAYPRPLELRVVTYDDLFEQCDPETLRPVLELTDTVTYWTWKAKNIPRMAAMLNRLRQLAPGKRIDVGIYLWDFGDCREMPVEAIRGQLDVACGLLKRGDVHGLVFLCSSICNRRLAAVDYARDWLARHGDDRLPEPTGFTDERKAGE